VDAEEYAAKMVDETVKEAVAVLQREATEKANQHHEVMQGMTEREAAEYVKRVIANAPLVFGVYQDAESPIGVGMYVIKGKRELQASIAAGLPIQIEVNAIHCIEREQAIAAAEAYGDGQML
jgi:deoxyribodipyrimidine photolyase-like uncharacterized protein